MCDGLSLSASISAALQDEDAQRVGVALRNRASGQWPG